MALTVSLSTIPPLLGKAEGAGDRKVNLDTVLREHDVAIKKLAIAGDLFIVTQLGRNGAGVLTLTGAKVGDKVAGVANLTTPGDLRSSFESTITVADQIQQSAATNLSAAQVQFIVVHLS